MSIERIVKREGTYERACDALGMRSQSYLNRIAHKKDDVSGRLVAAIWNRYGFVDAVLAVRDHRKELSREAKSTDLASMAAQLVVADAELDTNIRDFLLHHGAVLTALSESYPAARRFFGRLRDEVEKAPAAEPSSESESAEAA